MTECRKNLFGASLVESETPKRRIFVREDREPRLIAYAIGCLLAVTATYVSNRYALDWPVSSYSLAIAGILGLYGVFSIENCGEGCFFVLFATIPLAIVLWLDPSHSIPKQLWVSAVAGIAAGKLWVGIIR